MTVTSRRSRTLFTPDGAFRSKDGVMEARGTEAVLEQFRGRFRALKLSNHFSHDHVFEFGADPDAATGLVTAHAEVWRNGRALIGALRYQDSYRRHQGRWCFADRLLFFLYYLPVEEYASASGIRCASAPTGTGGRRISRKRCRPGSSTTTRAEAPSRLIRRPGAR